MFRKIFVSLVLSSSAISLAAQNAAPGVPNSPARQGQFEPCWQQAGLQKSVALQLASIQREARSQVEGVCSSTSLTPQQRRQQVQEIRGQARQKMEGLITPEQEKTFLQCRQERTGETGHAGLGGGCGGSRGRARSGANCSPNTNSETSSTQAKDESSPE